MVSVNLMLGDCLEQMKEIPEGSIDLVLADPPYGTTQNKWDSVLPLDELWEECWRIVKQNGAVVLTAQTPFDKVLGVSALRFLKYEWIWEKGKATGFLNAKRQPLKSHENVLVFYRSQCTYNPQGLLEGGQNNARPAKGISRGENYGAQRSDHGVATASNYPRSNLKISGVSKPFHPTQKPVALMEYLILTYTNEGETVLDFTMGSGTTGVACVNTGRSFIGIERDEGYFAIAEKRIAKAQEEKK